MRKRAFRGSEQLNRWGVGEARVKRAQPYDEIFGEARQDYGTTRRQRQGPKDEEFAMWTKGRGSNHRRRIYWSKVKVTHFADEFPDAIEDGGVSAVRTARSNCRRTVPSSNKPGLCRVNTTTCSL